METIIIRALQLIVSLSILVIVHEFGHFIFARLFKVRVEKFYLFFNPWFSLFKFKPKNSETEYGIGWLPLGGYVKIAGMIDESMDKEQLAQPEQAWEFRAKPAGQRLLIMLGGVLLNFILAFFIYSMVLLAWGDKYIPLKNVTMGMSFSPAAQNAGFRDGDILLATDEKPLERMGTAMLFDIVEARQVTVLRNGKEATVHIPADMMQRLLREKKGFTDMRLPFVVDSVMSGKAAAAAGLLPGDSITGIGEKQDMDYASIGKVFKENKGKELQLNLYRNRQAMSLALTPDTAGMVGVSLRIVYQSKETRYGFFGSFPAGIQLGVETLSGYVKQFKYVFTKEGAGSLGGFGTIASIFPPVWDWHAFWMMSAFLSIILGFMNIIPIPALDGGHVMFLLYEIITRRKPSDKFLERAQIAGMALLIALLLYANGNDVFRAIF
ncbi:MAG: RIP metalloprotease RseP [Dysgonamonadaceae bacterium]|jgi:regulator of sigma E protease|nr:RIP metalloprotease RseP [Dysgonamonadaceae bacterium]